MLYFRLVLSSFREEELIRSLEIARNVGDLTVVNRILAVLSYIKQDVSIETIAKTLRVSTEFVRVWIKKYVAGGVKALTFRKRSPGRPAKLTKTQRRQLEKMIEEGPEKAGFPGACWRTPMIQELIFKLFGVLYKVRYISQLLRNMGFSYQKARFAVGGKDPKNQNERQKWLDKTWFKALKLAKERKAYMFYEDEVSFPQWGSLTHTWAKRGQQPTVKTSGIRKCYKAFGLIDYFTGRFFYKTTESRLNSESYIDFLKDVLSKTRKHIILIHDGASYHESKAVREFIQTRANRLTVYKLPAYSPDFNPIEKVWKKIKEEHIHLHYFPTFESLKQKVDKALADFAKRGEKLLSVFTFYKEMGSV
jgi:transposase